MPARTRIVPTGPESFAAEMLLVDGDFFGGTCACEDCRIEAALRGHPVAGDEAEAGDEGQHDEVAAC